MLGLEGGGNGGRLGGGGSGREGTGGAREKEVGEVNYKSEVDSTPPDFSLTPNYITIKEFQNFRHFNEFNEIFLQLKSLYLSSPFTGSSPVHVHQSDQNTWSLRLS